MQGRESHESLVDAIDIQVIMANIGRVGEHLTTYDGDVNGDSRVDEIDLMIALDHLGETIFTYFDGEGGAASSGGWRVLTDPDCDDGGGGVRSVLPHSTRLQVRSATMLYGTGLGRFRGHHIERP